MLSSCILSGAFCRAHTGRFPSSCYCWSKKCFYFDSRDIWSFQSWLEIYFFLLSIPFLPFPQIPITGISSWFLMSSRETLLSPGVGSWKREWPEWLKFFCAQFFSYLPIWLMMHSSFQHVASDLEASFRDCWDTFYQTVGASVVVALI